MCFLFRMCHMHFIHMFLLLLWTSKYQLKSYKSIFEFRYTLSFKQHFYKQHQAEINSENLHLKTADLFKYVWPFCYHQALKVNEIMWLIILKMRLKMKNEWLRYDINRTRPRHVHKYTKYKMCLGMMMVMCNKQHLSSMWSSIHGKVNQYWS